MKNTRPGDIWIILAASVVSQAVSSFASCSGGKCLTGGFFFNAGKNLLENHALLGHGIKNLTASRPMVCFEHCAKDCRCISFNYLKVIDKNNCQLNTESRHTKPEALQPQDGSQYYDLVIDYNIKVGASCGQCQNGCCQNRKPCNNGGTCHETCDVKGPRFNCSCKPCFTGKYCEIFMCPPGWLLFNGSCFKQFKTRLNFTDAKQACDKMNSSFASIHSAEEHDFIYRHVLSKDSSLTFIGFNDIANEGTFEWSDRSAVTYTNWAGGNPDNFGQGQDCSVISTNWNGLWDDIPCFELHPFICRKKWCSYNS